MAGETEVINVGLSRIGASTITSLTDGSKSANAAGNIYEQVRDAVLRSNPWNFATKRIKLAQSSVVPVFGFDHAYPLPAQWLRTISVHNNDAGSGTILYRSELHEGQRAIITSWDEVWLRYVERVTDTNLWDVQATDALSCAIARDLAIPLSSSKSLRDEMKAEYKATLAAARSTDAIDGFPEQRPRGSWTTIRGRRGRHGFLGR